RRGIHAFVIARLTEVRLDFILDNPIGDSVWYRSFNTITGLYGDGSIAQCGQHHYPVIVLRLSHAPFLCSTHGIIRNLVCRVSLDHDKRLSLPVNTSWLQHRSNHNEASCRSMLLGKYSPEH